MNNIILQQFVSKTDPKQGFSFIVSGNHSQIHTRFNPLKIGKNYEMSLVNHETYYVYSIPNIHTGSYGINDEIQRQLRLNKHKAKIIIDANRETLRASLTLARHYKEDFNFTNSRNTVLGLERQIYTYDRAIQKGNTLLVSSTSSASSWQIAVLSMGAMLMESSNPPSVVSFPVSILV